MTRFALLGLAMALSLGAAPDLRAETFVLDAGTGAAYEGVGDGWLFAGPSVPPPDGVGDADGQANLDALFPGVCVP